MQAQALLTSSSSIPFPQHDLLTHKNLFYSLTLGHAREYSQATCALAPFSPALTSSDTTSTLTTLHPKANGYFPFFLENYKLNQKFKLSFDSLKLAFQHMSHLMASGLFGMIFECFWDYFHLEA